MCKFSNLVTGEQVELSANLMYCYSCNTQFSYRGDATYSGHSLFNGMLYDCFTHLNTACPGCDIPTGQYIELCKDVNYSVELIVTEVDYDNR
jgi:hypothetical protein